jgi:hypothetical protein
MSAPSKQDPAAAPAVTAFQAVTDAGCTAAHSDLPAASSINSVFSKNIFVPLFGII